VAVHEDLPFQPLNDIVQEVDALVEHTLDVLPGGVLQEEVQLGEVVRELVESQIRTTVDYVCDARLLQQLQIFGHGESSHLQFVFKHGRYFVFEKIQFHGFPVSVFDFPVLLVKVFFVFGGVVVFDELVVVLISVQ